MMHSNKILFISPTPVFPANAGNRQHIKSLIDFFKQYNWEVHFLYLALEDYNEVEMKDFFADKLYIIHKEEIYQKKKTIQYIFSKAVSSFNKVKRRVQYYAGIISGNQLLYNNEVDNYYSAFVNKAIKKIQQTHSFKYVVCEYAFISKSLKLFDHSVFKILDTHDRFTDRFQKYLDVQQKPTWVSLFKSQESKAVKRADLVLAANADDTVWFSKLGAGKTAIFNYAPSIINLTDKVPVKTLLYLASDNENNLASIQYFIDHIFPEIIRVHPDVLLRIGGSICKKLTIQHKNIILQGYINDQASFYGSGDIVINPELSGTGYKVKAMEALSYGMPFVATTAGAAGVLTDVNDHLFIANNPEEFANTIHKLFMYPILMKETSVKAHQWMMNYKENITNNLLLATKR